VVHGTGGLANPNLVHVHVMRQPGPAAIAVLWPPCNRSLQLYAVGCPHMCNVYNCSMLGRSLGVMFFRFAQHCWRVDNRRSTLLNCDFDCSCSLADQLMVWCMQPMAL